MTRGTQFRIELSAHARRRGHPKVHPGGSAGLTLGVFSNVGLGVSLSVEAVRALNTVTNGARRFSIHPRVTVYDPRGVRRGEVR